MQEELIEIQSAYWIVVESNPSTEYQQVTINEPDNTDLFARTDLLEFVKSELGVSYSLRLENMLHEYGSQILIVPSEGIIQRLSAAKETLRERMQYEKEVAPEIVGVNSIANGLAQLNELKRRHT